MKKSIILLVFLSILLAALKILGLLDASPVLLFIATFGLAMIMILVGFIIFARERQGAKHD